MLGANDGIISVATALVALMSSLTAQQLLLTALVITLAGAVSMSAGEYVSVAAQRDAERRNRQEQLTSPMHAAVASFLAFGAGALIPALIAMLTHNVWFVIGAVLLVLALTAVISSDKADRVRATVRMMLVGASALTISLLANITIESISSFV